MGDIDIDDLLHDLHDVTAFTPQKPASSNNYPGSNSNALYDSSNNSASSSIFPHPPQEPNPGQNPKSRFVRSDGSTSQKTSPVYKTSSSAASNISNSLQKEVDQNLDDWLDSLTISSNNNATTANSLFNGSNVLPPSPNQQTNNVSSFSTTTFSPEIAKSNQSIYQQLGLSTSLEQTTDDHNRSFTQSKSNKTNSTSNLHIAASTVTSKRKMHHSHTDDLENSWDEDDDDFNNSSINNDSSSHNGSFSLASLSNTSFSRKTLINCNNNNNSVSTKLSSIANNNNTNTSNSSQKVRCCQVVLGTASSSRSHRPSSFSPCVCDALLCSQCNFKVLFFPHKKWSSTADYLFFRNNMPNTDKLGAKLEKDDGGGAYCCQCKSANISAAEEMRVLSIGNPQDPQWICVGHIST